MPLPKELQDIVDELEYDSEEDRAAFEKLMEGKVGQKIKAGYMKNADYTTKTSAVAQAKQALEAAQAKFNDEQDYVLSTTAQWKMDMEKRLNDAIKQAADSDLRGAALTSKLRTIAAQYGEDPDELLKDVQASRGAGDDGKGTGKAVNYDDEELNKRFVDRKRFDEVSNVALAFPAMIRDFERDYKKTFGKDYDGSMQELVAQMGPEVEKQRARGRNVDLFGLMREKLDFSGQVERNKAAESTKAEEERKKWEEDKAKEIEANVRSQYLAANPGAMRKQEATEDWRQGLSADARKAKNNEQQRRTTNDTLKRQQEIHRAYEETAAKSATG